MKERLMVHILKLAKSSPVLFLAVGSISVCFMALWVVLIVLLRG